MVSLKGRKVSSITIYTWDGVKTKHVIKNHFVNFEQFMWVCDHFENFAQVSEAGDVWTIKTSTTLKTMELKFKVYLLTYH